jgi:hypothetical protein
MNQLFELSPEKIIKGFFIAFIASGLLLAFLLNNYKTELMIDSLKFEIYFLKEKLKSK